jgi:hypothetical protein
MEKRFRKPKLLKKNQPMSKAKKSDPAPSLKVTGKFYTVGKSGHLLAEAFEIELKDGVVVGVKSLSRAPDLSATAVGICSREIWVNLRTQQTDEIKQ